MKPTLWALIAARSSGASAIRSTRRCASSLASSRRQTSSTISLSSASINARLTVSLSSAPLTASSTSGPCRTRTRARSTASLSTAETIASSAADWTARSTPAALPTVRAPRTPAPSRRTESGSGPPAGPSPCGKAWGSGASAIVVEYTVRIRAAPRARRLRRARPRAGAATRRGPPARGGRAPAPRQPGAGERLRRSDRDRVETLQRERPDRRLTLDPLGDLGREAPVQRLQLLPRPAERGGVLEQEARPLGVVLDPAP